MVIVSTFYNRWDGVSGKAHLEIRIEVIYSLYQSYAPYLKKIVRAVPLGIEATDNT